MSGSEEPLPATAEAVATPEKSNVNGTFDKLMFPGARKLGAPPVSGSIQVPGRLVSPMIQPLSEPPGPATQRGLSVEKKGTSGFCCCDSGKAAVSSWREP